MRLSVDEHSRAGARQRIFPGRSMMWMLLLLAACGAHGLSVFAVPARLPNSHSTTVTWLDSAGARQFEHILTRDQHTDFERRFVHDYYHETPRDIVDPVKIDLWNELSYTPKTGPAVIRTHRRPLFSQPRFTDVAGEGIQQARDAYLDQSALPPDVREQLRSQFAVTTTSVEWPGLLWYSTAAVLYPTTLIVVTLILLRVRREIDRWDSAAQGLCPACRYPRVASGTCPECGTRY